MLGIVGVLVALALLIYLALRGVSILPVSVLCAGIVAVANRISLNAALAGTYMLGLAGFLQQFFLLFLFGAMFGKIMGDSGAAAAIALILSRKLGAGRALLIIVLACAILSFGGVNIFILIFTVYPLGLQLWKRANLPKRLLVGAFALGGATFTMSALPGTPSVQNLIPAEAFKTPATAAPALGIAAAIVMFAFGYWYLTWQAKKAHRSGEGFAPSPCDVAATTEIEPRDLPHWAASLVPLALVVGVVIATRNAKPQLPWVAAALAIGCVAGVAILWRHIKRITATLGEGAANSALPVVNTGAVIGFGTVVSTVPAFADFASFFAHLHLPPLLSAAVVVNIMGGIMGSAAGGLRIFIQTMAPEYLRLGVDPAELHRVSVIASGGLSSLPHNGVVITTLLVMGMTHREAYKEIFVETVLVSLAGVAAALVIAAIL
jgi:H+/gluconate symporter-like permease